MNTQENVEIDCVNLGSSDFGAEDVGDESNPADLQRGVEQLLASLEATDDPDSRYVPALRAIRSFSRGYAQRVPDELTHRVIDLLSRHEFHAYLLYSWDRATYSNIREQFPLPLDLTRAIAAREGIRHPWNRDVKCDAVMTTDFVLSRRSGGWLAVDVKEKEAIARKRTAQKLQIARAAFAEVGVEHVTITEADLPQEKIRNLRILRGLRRDGERAPVDPELAASTEGALRQLLAAGKLTIEDAASVVSQKNGVRVASICRFCLWLIANRTWQVDLGYPLGPDYPVRFAA